MKGKYFGYRLRERGIYSQFEVENTSPTYQFNIFLQQLNKALDPKITVTLRIKLPKIADGEALKSDGHEILPP